MTAVNTAGAEGTAASHERWLCSRVSQGGCPLLGWILIFRYNWPLLVSKEWWEMLSSCVLVEKGGFY